MLATESFFKAVEARQRILSRKEMKGGNGVREANVVTLCLKCANQTDEAGTPPLDVARPRATKNADASNNPENVLTTPSRWIAAVSATEEISRKVREVREVI